jgi:Protein of unknown function (DUF3592)
MARTLPPIPRGCAWTSLAVGAVFAILGALSLAAIPIVWKRSQEVWTEARGTVTETSIQQGERRSNQYSRNASRRTKTYSEAPTYTVVLKYDYEVDGQRRTGFAPAIEQPEDDEVHAEAAAIAETYPVGRTMPVFYKPQDPAQSRLTVKEAPREFLWDIVFGGAFALIGLGGLALGRIGLKR